MGNIQEGQSTVSRTFVTDTNVRTALKRVKGSEANLVSWAVKDFTSKGDNYASVVTSVEVKYVLDGGESTVSFITKICPPNSDKYIYDSSRHMFMKEARVYSELIPALNSELTSIGMAPLRVPGCHYSTYEAGKEVIHLQDLRSTGFKLSDRNKGLDLPHVTLIVEELARLHASSVLLRVKDGHEDHDAKYKFLQKDYFDLSEDGVKVTAGILKGHIEKTIFVLKSFEGYAKAAHWLERFKQNAFEELMKQLGNDERFAVVIHGDCWTNNALFRYDDKGHPIDLMLIDLQMFRRASLAADLSLFFYISLTGPERKANMEAYLDIYYASFKRVLDAGGQAMPFTRPELSEEYETKHLYGILWALVFVPLIVCENEEVSEWDITLNQGDSSASSITKEQKDNILLMFNKNPEMRSRFFSLFDVIMEGGRGIEGH